MNFELSYANTTDEMGSVFIPTARVGRPIDGSNWIPPEYDISEATADRVSKTMANNGYNFKSDFETRKDIQYFGRQNDPMSPPTFDSTPFGKKTTNGTTSPIESITFKKKMPEPTPLTRPT